MAIGREVGIIPRNLIQDPHSGQQLPSNGTVDFGTPHGLVASSPIHDLGAATECIEGVEIPVRVNPALVRMHLDAILK